MRNAEIAEVLARIARLLDVSGAIRFKIQAHERAAQLVSSLDRPLADVYRDGGVKGLMALPGIGEGIAGKIEELLTKGRSAEYEKLKASLPPGIEELLEVPGLGPKTALLVAKTLKVRSVADLERAIAAHKVAKLPRMGAKQEEKLLKGIAMWKGGQARLPLGDALGLGTEILTVLEALPQAKRAALAGSLRRMRETVGDLDILVSAGRPGDAGAIMDAFVKLPHVKDVVARGETKVSVRLGKGLDADLRVVEDGAFGAALHYFTGSKAHNIKVRELGVKRGLRINEYGVHRDGKRIAGAEETEIFRAVGLPFIPPELREDQGEIEAAAQGALPALIEAGDLKGDVHMHTKWSDGVNTAAEMARAAQALGYQYIALCDHSQSLKMAGGLSVERLRKKNQEIDALNRTLKGFRVLKGSEVDILEDGSLDYPDEVLAELDVVVASIHTRFTLDREAQTRRAVRALGNKHVTVLAHPTGRLIGRREGYAIDLDQVIKAARAHGKALEVNAQPDRLDLSDAALRTLRGTGMPLLIDSDAHRAEQLVFARRLGVGVARRGWVEAKDVLNALPLAQLLKRLGK